MTIAPPMETRAAADWSTAIGRSALYAFLGRALVHPTDASLEAIRATLVPVLAALEVGEPDVRAARDRVVAAAEDVSAADLRRAYVSLFTHVVTPDCPVYETAYQTTDVFQQAHTMADVSGFYRAHGIRIGGRERERPDHIGPELEFMGFVARQEAEALAGDNAEGVSACRRTQALFLRDHLGCWGPGFGRRVAALAPAPYYRALGDLLTAWFEADLERLHVTPARVLDNPLPLALPDDGECGGDDCLDCPVETGVGADGAALIEPAQIQ